MQLSCFFTLCLLSILQCCKLCCKVLYGLCCMVVIVIVLQEFGDVLREMMPMMMALYSGKKPTVAESTDDDGTVVHFLVMFLLNYVLCGI